MVWNAATECAPLHILEAHTWVVRSLVLLPDTLITAGDDGRTMLWDRKETNSYSPKEGGAALLLSDWLWDGGEDPAFPEEDLRRRTRPPPSVSGLAAEEGTVVICTEELGLGSTVRVWDLGLRQVRHTLPTRQRRSAGRGKGGAMDVRAGRLARRTPGEKL